MVRLPTPSHLHARSLIPRINCVDCGEDSYFYIELMITPATLRNALFLTVWALLLWYLYTPETIKVNGCKYEKHTEPDGSSWLVHVDSCGCMTKFEETQYEFKN